MYIIKMVLAIKGIEQGMEEEIKEAAERAFTEVFRQYGIMEFLIVEATEEQAGLEVK